MSSVGRNQTVGYTKRQSGTNMDFSRRSLEAMEIPELEEMLEYLKTNGNRSSRKLVEKILNSKLNENNLTFKLRLEKD
ncbi:MAG: hypothetical protein CVT92_02310 [Bacteroidetes bacterium HGW-Bacteroidetes-1]|jgi:hypothetical protein|nr:MAG: hypothetical protein CVT92_02310 [Bacteroidetes bacterium HGW-Bacteroidetes-1]